LTVHKGHEYKIAESLVVVILRSGTNGRSDRYMLSIKSPQTVTVVEVPLVLETFCHHFSVSVIPSFKEICL
jgi:hypothetical protein